jgi:alpha-glucosidase (family GH31 glycosyl hydrolase)
LSELFKNWARNAMHQRLNFVRHLYSCLHSVSDEGGTCFDPLLFHYPEDEVVFKNIEHSFIFGNAIKVSPILNAS